MIVEAMQEHKSLKYAILYMNAIMQTEYLLMYGEYFWYFLPIIWYIEVIDVLRILLPWWVDDVTVMKDRSSVIYLLVK